MGADVDLTAAQRRAIACGRRLIGDFADSYLIYRRRGWTHREIAQELGYRNKYTVGRLVTRARAAGLLPPPGREELAHAQR